MSMQPSGGRFNACPLVPSLGCRIIGVLFIQLLDQGGELVANACPSVPSLGCSIIGVLSMQLLDQEIPWYMEGRASGSIEAPAIFV